MNKIILDCSLRDGGYYNNWQFSKNFVQKYINLISKTKVSHVEIGFLFFPKDKRKGLTANCDKSFFKNFKFPTNVQWGIMINASDLINKSNIADEKKKIKILKDLNKTNLSFIRIACHFHEVFKIEKYLKILKKNNKLKLFINVMQISEINKSQIKKICKFSNYYFDYLYVADSLGSLKKIQLKKIIKLFKKYWFKKMGIHAHDNLSLALSNTIYANKLGITWLDSTITGMGRGPGNTKTEELINFFYEKENFKNESIKKLLKIFSKLKQKYKWGTNVFYQLSGKYKIHPTYIQNMLADSRYEKDDYFKAIKYLKNNDAKSYNPFELLSAFNIYKFNEKIYSRKNYNLVSKYFSQVLILGPGNELNKIKINLEKKIKTTKTLVISLNNSKQFDNRLINIRAICHPMRILSNLNYLKHYRGPLLVPYSCLSPKIRKIFKNKNIIDYGIFINKKISINKEYISVNSPLALIYSIGYLISKGFKKIYLAGFDGYLKDVPNQDSTQDLLNDISKKYKTKKINFASLTKTKLNLRFANIKELK